MHLNHPEPRLRRLLQAIPDAMKTRVRVGGVSAITLGGQFEQWGVLY